MKKRSAVNQRSARKAERLRARLLALEERQQTLERRVQQAIAGQRQRIEVLESILSHLIGESVSELEEECRILLPGEF